MYTQNPRSFWKPSWTDWHHHVGIFSKEHDYLTQKTISVTEKGALMLHFCKAFAFQFVLSVFRTPLIIRKATRLTLSFFFRVGGKKRWKTLWRDCRTEALQQDLRWLQAQQGVSMRRKLNFNTLHDFREEIHRSGQVVRLERLGYLFFQLWRGPPEPQPLHCCPGGPTSLSRVFASEATSVLRQRNVF